MWHWFWERKFPVQSHSVASGHIEEELHLPAESVEGYGNVLTATAALHGLASEELSASELAYRDRDYDVIIGIRAVRSGRGIDSPLT